MTPAEVLAFAKQKGIAMVDLKFIDLPGLWQHFTIPISELDESVFTEGVGFDGSSIRGFQEIHESDMLLIPDPATAVLDPICKAPTLSMICAGLRPDHQAVLLPRPPVRGQEGRGLLEVHRHRRHQLLGPGDGILHL